MSLVALQLVPWLPALAALLCGVCCVRRGWRWLAAPICITSIATGFVLVLLTLGGTLGHADNWSQTLFLWSWLDIGSLDVDFAYFIDPLTMLMLLVVTGVGSLIAIYAAGYMKGDPGYARFFASVSLFIFAMTTLVMADNLVLLYLGWEGVGLCSYLLIGYYYRNPIAVAAAKKAFIVNRIGDLGFALGIFLIFLTFGSVEFKTILPAAQAMLTDTLPVAGEAQAAVIRGAIAQAEASPTWMVLTIPFLLMLGAFGKSAQLPLYVWLPDAMAGPTPVSALVHAATMVTAGVYLIARCVPLFQLSPWALPVVALVGGVTALYAATIALVNNDLKGVFAYSTISQLGYMFLGVGSLSAFGGVFHLMTHAFFKALLFLTAGSVMHALAGQLDIRTMSGMGKKMPVTKWLMFAGCLSLAGFPFTAGFFSKDTILGDTLALGLNGGLAHGFGTHGPNTGPLYIVLALLGLLTALLTAFYTFRLWFTVFTGPLRFEMGEEHHGEEESEVEGHAADDPHHAPASAHAVEGHEHDHGHAHEPHEMPWLPMNLPLAVLAVLSIIGGWPGLIGSPLKGWLSGSSLAPTSVAHHGAAEAVAVHHDPFHAAGPFTANLHFDMLFISGLISILGIAGAWYFFSHDRAAAGRWADKASGVVRVLRNKYYVDEFYDAAIVRPLRTLGLVLYVFDAFVIGGLVSAATWIPRGLGFTARPTQNGQLQRYGVTMALGLAALAVLVLWATML